MYDNSHLFTLRVRVLRGEPMIVVRAYENGTYDSGHTRLDIEVCHDGKTVFPRGSLYCGIPAGHSIDGTYARESVLSTVAMKPGDTDAEYFASYTPDQIAFSERYGEELWIVKHDRYCDENGNVRD